MQGRVIANFGAALAIETADHHILRCNHRRKLGLIVCGDRIEYALQADATESAVITRLLNRQSVLARPDRKQQLKPLAANFDRLLIVTAPRPEPDTLLIDAYLVYAEHVRITPVIVINKMDLITREQAAQFDAMQQRYQQLGYTVVRNSCKIENGLEALKTLLDKHTAILVGQSGVGKSSIIKSLLPDKDIQTQAVSDATGFGAHTTTTAMLYHLPDGGELIDSPGVREFNVSHLDPDIIRNGFIEFRALQDHCKFSNCTHLREPGCAVLNAVGKDEIDTRRWENYRKMLEGK